MFSRVKEIRWREFETFLYAGLCYGWVAELLDLSGKIHQYDLSDTFSNTDFFFVQAAFLVLTLVLLWYTHRLMKTHTARTLMMAFFAALFFALWNPIHVFIAMIAMASIYTPKHIHSWKLPRAAQPIFALVLIGYIYLDGISQVTNGLASSSGMALRLTSLAILIELAVVYTWYHGTGRGPELLK